MDGTRSCPGPARVNRPVLFRHQFCGHVSPAGVARDRDVERACCCGARTRGSSKLVKRLGFEICCVWYISMFYGPQCWWRDESL